MTPSFTVFNTFWKFNFELSGADKKSHYIPLFPEEIFEGLFAAQFAAQFPGRFLSISMQSKN